MKINCPFHQDNTASLKIYEDHFFCFGCGAKGSPDLIPDAPKVRKGPVNKAGWGEKEDINKSLTRIQRLPTKSIRGFTLPFDETGYYIVYPGGQYYTKRLSNPEKPSDKYRGPKGHKKPLLILPNFGNNGALYVVEGQLNAQSLWMVLDSGTVISPGAATDLNRPEFVSYYLRYKDICVVVDKDAAGVVAGIALRDELLRHKRNVVLYPMERDLNDIYVEQGEAKVKEEYLAMCKRLSE